MQDTSTGRDTMMHMTMHMTGDMKEAGIITNSMCGTIQNIFAATMVFIMTHGMTLIITTR